MVFERLPDRPQGAEVEGVVGEMWSWPGCVDTLALGWVALEGASGQEEGFCEG